MHKTTVQLEQNLYDALRNYAHSNRLSMGEVIREAIREKIDFDPLSSTSKSTVKSTTEVKTKTSQAKPERRFGGANLCKHGNDPRLCRYTECRGT